MRALNSLAECWLSTAETLEGAFDERGAALYRRHAAELQEALREAADEVLTLSEASSESGYSESRLRHLIADGTIPQAGERGRPRVRRGDLPQKPQKNGQSTTDIEREANAVLGHIS